MAVLKKNKRDCQIYLYNKLAPAAAQSTRELAQKLLCRKLSVEGFDQPTWVIKYMEAVEFMDLMPPEYAREVRRHINTVFRRFESGDAGMHAELLANAQSTDVRHEFARGGQALQVAAVDPLALRQKELELRRLEIELDERAAAVSERPTRLRLEVEQHTIKVEQHDMAMVDRYKQLVGEEHLDERDRLRLKSHIDNVLYKRQLAICDAPGAPSAPPSDLLDTVTVSEVIRDLGFRQKPGDDKAVGRRMAAKYREATGASPVKCRRFCDNEVRKVCSYGQSFRPMLEETVREYYAERRKSPLVAGQSSMEAFFVPAARGPHAMDEDCNSDDSSTEMRM